MYIFRDKEINCAKMNEEASEIDRVGLREMWAHLSSVQIDYVVVSLYLKMRNILFILLPQRSLFWLIP